jgi:hypothetical protein
MNSTYSKTAGHSHSAPNTYTNLEKYLTVKSSAFFHFRRSFYSQQIAPELLTANTIFSRPSPTGARYGPSFHDVPR